MMTWKLKSIMVAVAFVTAGAAQAEFTNPRGSTIADGTTTGTTGGSLIFEAWDASQAFIYDLGSLFNPVYSSSTLVTQGFAAGQGQLIRPKGPTVYNLGADFVTAFGNNPNVSWRVLSGKSANDATSRQGMFVTSRFITGTYVNQFNNTALNTSLVNLNNGFNNIITNVAEPSGLVNNTNPAYTPSNTSVNLAAALTTAMGAINGSGYFAGDINPAMSYTWQPGVMYFTALVNTGGSGLSNTNRYTFASNHDGNALTAALPNNWILKNDGTLTYVSAVPEPETYAMMLLGVGLVAWRLRARGRASSALRLA